MDNALNKISELRLELYIDSLNLDQPQIVSFIQPEPSVMKQADKEKEFSHDELAYILRGLRS